MIRFLFVLAAIAAHSAYAGTYRIDDTGTQLQTGTIVMRWAQQAPGRRAGDANAERMVGLAPTDVRLNLGPWVNRKGRIYLVIPQSAAGMMTASWPADGPFMEGRGQSGQRVLLYAGAITRPTLEGVLRMRLEIEHAKIDAPVRVDFNFEMDTEN